MSNIKDNQNKFKELREEYPIFYYRNYESYYDEKQKNLQMSFLFECGKYKFSPNLKIDFSKLDINKKFTANNLSNLVFHIGMIELISYWKAFASPKVMIEPFVLNDKQIAFWKKLYFNGLGEYFYLNSIKTNIDEFMIIANGGVKKYESIIWDNDIDRNRVLVPIGGGKDSVVSLEILKNGGYDVIPLLINPNQSRWDSIKASGIKNEYIIVSREIDQTLIKLNSEGFLNGHTPFSAMLAFVSLSIAFITQTPNIALSNEASANEPTVIGEDINHQYSKSLEFERDFREYVEEFVGKGFNYFSFLRPLSELQIAQSFSLFTQYHKGFRSCNVGSKKDEWCCNCPKCLFAYIILSPFIRQEELSQYFTQNLLDKPSLKKYLDELIGKSDIKPFECVGTIEEVNQALSLLIKRFPNQKDLKLVQYWRELESSKQYMELENEDYLYNISDDHFLEKKFLKLIFNTYSKYKKEVLKRELQQHKILIFGFGKEGQATYNLLKEILPSKQLGIIDDNPNLIDHPLLQEAIKQESISLYLGAEGRGRLSKSNPYDIVFKTPGIAVWKYKSLFKGLEISSQTDMFLRLFADQCIGITGTKGKSSTSTLVYEMIKAKHSDTILAGNIGLPMFEIIENITPNTIIVLELSAHQLEYIQKAPKVSVLLNLYEEHLDHFQNFSNYQKAKLNILKQQSNKENIFIYNENDALIKLWLKDIKTQSKLMPINLKDYSLSQPLFLPGEHNKFNILVAYNVAKALGLESEEGIKAILEFRGLKHRLQFVCSKDGVDYYNDSISTIPQATIAALDSLNGVQTLILGGMDRGIDYSVLEDILFVYKDLNNIVFVSDAGKRMKDIIRDNAEKKTNILVSNNYSEIVLWCKDKTQKGKKVLLSPAAPSYDMFKNFEERGDVFIDLVNKD